MQALPFIELSADYVLVGGSLLRKQGNLLYSGTIPAGRIKGGLVYITDVEATVTNILQVLAKYGADGHMWIPGIGVINGVTANNWANTAGTVAAVVGGPVAHVNEQSGSFTASQATAGSQPVLRTDKYRWEFDGTNDHFTLPYNPFNMSNDFCIVAGAALVGSGTARSIYGQSNNSNHVLPDFGFNAGGQLGIAAAAGATTMSAYGGTSNSDGGPLTTAVRVVAGNVEVQRNGLQVASTSMPAIASLPLAAAIGALPKLTTEKYFSGSIYPVVVIKGTVTNSEFGIIKDFVDAWVAGTKSFRVVLGNLTGTTNSTINSVVTINQVGDLNPIILTNRTSGVGPVHVQFNASTTQALSPAANRVYHELQYEWDFGDAYAATQTWDQGPLAAVANKNIAYGPVAGHVFETAGSYTVTLTVKDPTGALTSVSRSVGITVSSADVVFAGANTICLSTGTDFTGAPAGATTVPNATIANIQSALTAGKRVLLKRGDSWDTTSNITVSSLLGLLGAFGVGSRPRIRMTGAVGGLVFSTATDWRVVDIEITSDGIYSASKGCAAVVDSTNILFFRADLSQGRNIFSSSNSNGLGIFDSVFHEAFISAGICAYIDKVDNLAIYGTWMYLSTDHTCRVQGTAKAAISHNFFERPSTGSGCALTVRGKANDANVSLWNGLWTENVVVSNNFCTTSAVRGGSALAIKPQAVGHAERLRNILVEGNVLTSEDSTPFVSEVSHGLTFRNNIIISRFNFGMDFGYASTSTDVVPPPDSIWIYNNTFYKPDTAFINGFSAIAITNTTAITGMVIKNNVAYAPNDTRDGYTNGTAPVFFGSNTATEGVHYELGVNSNNAQVKNTLPFTTAAPVNHLVNAVEAMPSQFTPAGYPINAGAAVPIYRDFVNAAITGMRELGALQA